MLQRIARLAIAAPRRVIAGPKTGIARLRQIALDPDTGRIFAAVINNEYLPPYDIDKPRAKKRAKNRRDMFLIKER